MRRLDRAAAEMGRYPHSRAVELTLMEEAQAWSEIGNDRRRPVLRPSELGRCPRLVMVFEKAGELVLVVEAGEQVVADRPDVALPQTVVEPLVVAIVKALLLQRPFEVPVDLGHEGEGRILSVYRRRRLRPNRFRRYPPGALENLGQQQHRHVAAHAVALAGNRDQLVDARPLQFGIGVVELQSVWPTWKMGVAAVGQNLRSSVGVDPQVILRRARERLLAAFDIIVGMGVHPMMVG